jgi:hypothetical protein
MPTAAPKRRALSAFSSNLVRPLPVQRNLFTHTSLCLAHSGDSPAESDTSSARARHSAGIAKTGR